MDNMSADNNRGRSSFNVFYVLYILYRYTDERHMLTVGEIVQKAQQICNVAISDDTVGRLLNGLMSEVFMDGAAAPEAEKLKASYGFCIRRKRAGKGYLYYYDAALADAEVATLINAVESYSYFSTKDIVPLVNKIMRLRPATYAGGRYFDESGEERMGTESDVALLDKIKILLRAIRNNHMLNITYCYYNYNKQLVPRKGYPRDVQPMGLLWSNGYYYLQVSLPSYNNIVNLRIDKITFIEELDQKRELSAVDEKRETSVEYRRKHPVMYSGDIRAISLLCRDTGTNFICNNIIDTFGKECRIRPATDAELVQYLGHETKYYSAKGEQWLFVRAKATLGGAELWATQHCGDCVAVTPDELRDHVKENLRTAAENYKDNMD